ncbi:MAG TPA: ribonuclease III [Myxococcota bacterium]
MSANGRRDAPEPGDDARDGSISSALPSRPVADVEAVDVLSKSLGHVFGNPDLAATALSHPSHAHEFDGSRGNERLEFLGDAVLDLVVAELLFALHPEWSEGELTRARADLVNKDRLAESARCLGLDRLVRLGRTEQRTGGREKDSVLANCFEAVIGAVYVDAGLDAAASVVRRCLGKALAGSEAGRDAKTAFQEWSHAQFRRTPSYRLVQDSGVENDERRFTVEVRVGDEAWGTGVGRTKRAAERAAAAAALLRTADPA